MNPKIIIFILVLTLVGILLAPGLSGHSLGPDGFDDVSVDTGKKLRVNSKRIKQRIMELAKFGEIPGGGVHRVAFSEADIRARKYIMSLMQEAGMKVHIDTASNIIGRREGSNPQLPVILAGSHIDTVPQGGKYDGALGVISAVECVQVLHENNFITDHLLEVVVFSDEEGGLIGSRCMIGKMTPEALQVITHSGKIDIGVVQGIEGIHWWDVTIEGSANHAGTTPMDRRHDAQNMATTAPTGMIFVPSVGGISHSPKEYTRTPDIAKGANVLLQSILKIDRGVLGQ